MILNPAFGTAEDLTVDDVVVDTGTPAVDLILV